ncbi:MAG: hypothetical protein FWG63_04000 [Defluviitaleaceae bacterium]|nr:hypothetical protein [Defluviitaleaceae bacterium]
MKIIVLDNKGNVGRTYPRRARQLVLKGRATWINATAIVLLESEEVMEVTIDEGIETKTPDKNKIETSLLDISNKNGANESLDQETDKLLLYIAKQNVANKKAIITSILWLIPGLVLMILLTSAINDFFFAGIYFTWFAYTMFRAVKLMWPKLSKKEKEDPVALEYTRLKSLETQS